MSELQLFDSTQYCLQVAFLVFQHQSGQPLKHQGHVEHQHRVAGCHVTGLLSKTATGAVLQETPRQRVTQKRTLDLLPPRYLQQHLFALLELAAFEERSGQVQQHLCVLILVELLQAVLVLWRPKKKHFTIQKWKRGQQDIQAKKSETLTICTALMYCFCST